jgi:hypothetical protein
MTVPISRENWSAASQRNGGQYDERAAVYEGIRYQCHTCSTSFVFTPQAQQFAFEVEKKFVWWRPVYCSVCTVQLAELQARNRAMQSAWNAERQRLRTDKAFVSDWLGVLRNMATFGKANPSMETHLERLLQSITCDVSKPANRTASPQYPIRATASDA